MIDWAAERVMVTGGGGVLGRALAARLASLQPAALACPDRAACDLRDAEATAALFDRFRPGLVFHLAGRVSGIQGNLSFAGEAYRDNTLINLNVVEAARLCGARKVIAAGTVAVYADKPDALIAETDLWRGPPHGSEAAYGHAKLGMLAQLEAYRLQWGLDFAYLLFTNLYGPHDRFDERYGHVVPALVSRFHRLTREGAPRIEIWGDGSPTRDFLYAEDAAEAAVMAAEHLEGPVNVATGQSVPIRAVVEALREISGFSGDIAWDVSKPLGQLARRYDVARLSNAGWRPRHGLHDGLRRTYEWFDAVGAGVRR